MTEATSRSKIKLKHKARASIALLVVAVISITTATYAWFTITNTASVSEMELTVTTGTVLKVSTNFSTNIADYTSKITNEMVNAQLKANAYTVDTLASLRLMPLTSGNGGTKLYSFSRNTVAADPGLEPKNGGYLNLNLWFMATTDMDLYLNGQETEAGKNDNTYIKSKDNITAAQKPVEKCVRVGFTPYYSGNEDGTNQTAAATAAGYNAKGKAVVYEPNKDTAVTLKSNALVDSKNEYGTSVGALQQTFVKLGTNGGIGKDAEATQTIVKIKANIPVRVVMRVWLEGEDAQCVNGNGVSTDSTTNIEQAKFLANFRFTGANADGTMVD